MRFEENQILFGHDPTPRIVSVEPAGDGEVHVYRRSADGRSTELETATFAPFLWIAGAADEVTAEPLAGGLEFNGLVRCTDWKQFTSLRQRCAEKPSTLPLPTPSSNT